MKVSVVVMTYNHEPFIAQALDSVLAQRTRFDYEILITEDCSTDRTRGIVREYGRRHPDRVRLLLSERNLHSNAVVARAYRAARGEYVALLDGDDYWTAEDKLQRQAEFLDAHPECTICFHNALVVYEDGSRPPRTWTPAGHPTISMLRDLWMGNFIPTCSTVYRRGRVVVPEWYDTFEPMITDWPLHILHAEAGAIGYLDAVMGVYRQHRGGLYSPFDEARKQEWTLRFYRRMDACLGFRHHRLVERAIFTYFADWAEEYLRRGDLAAARRCFVRCLRPWLLRRRRALRRALRLARRLYVPGRVRVPAR